MIYNETRYNAHWNTKKLNELGEFARGKSKHRPRNDEKLFKDGKYPLIQTGDVKAANLMITKHEQEYSEFGLQQSKLWSAGTLCITIAANIAETGILAYPMCFPDSVVGFNAYLTESSEEFMHYVFTFIRNSIQNSVNGSIQDNINIEYLTGLDFKVPDKPYQDKIVHVLSLLDKKIELNNRVIAELEEMAKTIFDYWLVQFDFPNSEGKPYCSSGGEMAWNEQLKREIPKGWNPSSVDDLLDKTPNTTRVQSSEYLSKGSIPIIDQSANFIAGYTDDESALITTTNGVIVFGDHTRIVKFIGFDFARGADGTQVLISKKNVNMPQLLFYYCIQKIDLSNYGYARHFKFLKDSFVIVPSEEVAKQFNDIIEPLHKIITQKIFENQELAKFRDWLLPILMNGQVTFKTEDDSKEKYFDVKRVAETSSEYGER